MNNCVECGREINEGKKLCSNCQSKIWEIRLKRFAKNTADATVRTAETIADKTGEVVGSLLDSAGELYEKTSKNIEGYKQEQLIKSIEKKEKELDDLEIKLKDSIKKDE